MFCVRSNQLDFFIIMDLSFKKGGTGYDQIRGFYEKKKLCSRITFFFYMSPSPSPRSKCSLYVDLKGISMSLLKQLSE